MSTTNKIIEGMQLLSKYYTDNGKGGYHTGAEHDVIYMFTTDTPVSPDDIATLYDMGWFQEAVNHEEGESYDPEESWMIFV